MSGRSIAAGFGVVIVGTGALAALLLVIPADSSAWWPVCLATIAGLIVANYLLWYRVVTR